MKERAREVEGRRRGLQSRKTTFRGKRRRCVGRGVIGVRKRQSAWLRARVLGRCWHREGEKDGGEREDDGKVGIKGRKKERGREEKGKRVGRTMAQGEGRKWKGMQVTLQLQRERESNDSSLSRFIIFSLFLTVSLAPTCQLEKVRQLERPG